jgi:hypothetical protein
MLNDSDAEELQLLSSRVQQMQEYQFAVESALFDGNVVGHEVWASALVEGRHRLVVSVATISELQWSLMSMAIGHEC